MNAYKDYTRVELLEEMVKFQKDRQVIGSWTIPMLTRGISLYERLYETSETDALRSLTRSYVTHLKKILSSEYGTNVIPLRRNENL